MSSDSSDDDIFHRKHPAVKRSVGQNALEKHMHLAKYGKGIKLTQKTKELIERQKVEAKRKAAPDDDGDDSE